MDFLLDPNVAYVVIVAVGYPVLERTRPTARVARQLARTTPDTAPVGLYRLERWRGSLRYYLGRPITRLETPEEIREFLAALDAVVGELGQ